MNRREFIRELEYLLQDIPEEEKSDALAYYHDYLEEAGEEQKTNFSSPLPSARALRKRSIFSDTIHLLSKVLH